MAGTRLSLGFGNGGREPEGVDGPGPVDEEPRGSASGTSSKGSGKSLETPQMQTCH